MASSGPRAKRSRFVTSDPAVVVELVQDEERSNEGILSGEESELDRQLANESDESRSERSKHYVECVASQHPCGLRMQRNRLALWFTVVFPFKTLFISLIGYLDLYFSPRR